MVGFGLSSGFAHGRAGAVLWAALAFLAVGGAADMVSAAFRSTILQQAASDDVRGRLQGVFTVVVAGGPRLADAVHGGAAAIVGTTIAAAGGGALVVVGVLIAALAVPAFVRYRVVSTHHPVVAADHPLDVEELPGPAGYDLERGGGDRGGESRLA
jgi:hypothetical protein